MDELLMGKGVDPDEFMEDVHYRRELDGTSNPIGRVLDRIEKQKERGEKLFSFCSKLTDFSRKFT
ncbi:MAG: hypothetical protein JXA38_00440 [Methanosarcinaceae archaeon]|nr:hypothetical protein [Methanosarcinaceae archaeon]